MAIGTDALLNAMQSHCLATGLFEKVNGHEPKVTPAPTGLSAACWIGAISPTARASGLAITAAAVTLITRLYTNAQAEPADAIDPSMGRAVDVLMTALMGDFTLGGNCMSLDVFGYAGNPMTSEAGYIQYDDGAAKMRVFTIIARAVVPDAWEQAA
jgi:hypothetical protein